MASRESSTSMTLDKRYTVTGYANKRPQRPNHCPPIPNTTMPSTGWICSILPTIRGLRTLASSKWTRSTAPMAQRANEQEPFV